MHMVPGSNHVLDLCRASQGPKGLYIPPIIHSPQSQAGGKRCVATVSLRQPVSTHNPTRHCAWGVCPRIQQQVEQDLNQQPTVHPEPQASQSARRQIVNTTCIFLDESESTHRQDIRRETQTSRNLPVVQNRHKESRVGGVHSVLVVSEVLPVATHSFRNK